MYCGTFSAEEKVPNIRFRTFLMVFEHLGFQEGYITLTLFRSSAGFEASGNFPTPAGYTKGISSD
jgi:hypothetical protein